MNLTPVKAAAPAAPAGSAFFGGQTPQAYIASLFAPQQAQLQSQQALRSAGYQQLVKEFAASLGQLSQGLAPYAAASSQQIQNANDAGASLNASNPNASAQANLAAINAPQSQRDAAAAQNSTVFGGGAALLKYAGGVLPADQFSADAAGRAAYLAAQPAIGQQLAAQGLGQINSAAQADTFRLGQAKSSALQTAQSDLAKWQQAQTSLAQRQAALDFNHALALHQKLISDAGMTGYYIGADGKVHPTASTVKSQQAAQTAQQNANSNTARANQGAANLTLTQQRMAQAQLNSDRTYQLSLARLGIQGKAAQLRATALEQSLQNGGLLPAKIAILKGVAAQIAQHAYGGFTDAKGKKWPAVSYQQALQHMLVGDGKSGQVPVSIALNALNSVYTVPGERGRPFTGKKPSATDTAFMKKSLSALARLTGVGG